MAPAADNGVVLITGASSGLGEAFARAYAARGRDLILVARRLDRLEALSAELQAAHGVRALPFQIDLSVFGAESEVLKAVAAHDQTVDVLVNNAGFSIPQSFAAVSWAAQRDFLMTLVVSACGLAHGVLPPMIERGRGAIINVASLAGFAPGAAGHTLYPGAKSLAIKFSEALDAEYRPCGVRVTAVCPGFIRTGFAAANGTQVIMDASPRMFFQTAEQVVTAAIRANDRGRVIVVPGWHNKVAAALLRYLPESLVKALIHAGSAKYHLEA
jgi:short-subunit dehydrogenase